MKKQPAAHKTTTIQVRQELKNQLDLLKILGNHDDLNSLLEKITQFYIENSSIKIDPKIEKLLKKLKK